MSRKDGILEYLKNKKVDQKFEWGGYKWEAVYETVNSLHRSTNIPKASIYRSLKELVALDGFAFSQGLISYEWNTGIKINDRSGVMFMAMWLKSRAVGKFCGKN